MNLEEHKDKIDEFFNSISKEELKAKLKIYDKWTGDETIEWKKGLKNLSELYNVKLIKECNTYSYTDPERGYSEYKLLKDNISFKHPDNGEWIESVLYKSLKDGKEYVRQKVDFLNKFKKVE